MLADRFRGRRRYGRGSKLESQQTIVVPVMTPSGAASVAVLAGLAYAITVGDHYVLGASLGGLLLTLLTQNASRVRWPLPSHGLYEMTLMGLLALTAAAAFLVDRCVGSPCVKVSGGSLWASLAIVVTSAIAGNWVTRAVGRHNRMRTCHRSAVIAGVNESGRRLAERIRSPHQSKVVFRGFFDDRSLERLGEDVEGLVVDCLTALPEYVDRKRIDIVYVALPMAENSRVIGVVDALRNTTASVYFIMSMSQFEPIQSRVSDVGGIQLLSVVETPLDGVKGSLKRILDIVLSTLFLVLGAPVLLSIAAAVKLTSPGPVLFKQRRHGLRGAQIVVYKFRTMTVCEDGDSVQQATLHDIRITRLGAFLRRTSLDELPQFINVLQGRMSIVGPRPHAVAHNELYRGLIKGYMLRHKVRPGITGLAQVSGLRGNTEDLEDMRLRIEYDLEYLRRWSLALDLKIILRTSLVVLGDRNAY
jgi:putative colanic acid biosynthesis UDP-glucose lipid carrier transferase